MDLTDAYENGAYIPGAAAYPPRWAEAAAAYRGRLAVSGRARLGVMYGHGTRQAMDLFLPDGIARGLVAFVHGGYWRQFDRSSWSHLAEGARAQGWAVVVPSYDLCPRVRISEITRQVAQAVSVAAQEIDGPLRLAGHSAGGHLVARLATQGVLPEAVTARIAGVLPISPVADLRPLMQTAMNADLRLDPGEARAESPIFAPPPDAPVTVWVGAKERPVFVEQARKLSAVWEAGLVEAEGKHHFDVIDPLEDPDSEMVRRLLGA